MWPQQFSTGIVAYTKLQRFERRRTKALKKSRDERHTTSLVSNLELFSSTPAESESTKPIFSPEKALGFWLSDVTQPKKYIWRPWNENPRGNTDVGAGDE